MASEICPDNVGKQVWPELLGAAAEVAVETIRRENPNVKVIIIDEGTSTITVILCDTVRVWVERGIVVMVPAVG
ncbi:hypothetical protein Syun_010480 [Stephania yunnanensis]|uniref:Uncharacterized protein n=1 Tax=Stephania yunnanensis TaxID=152371 RepID=A0AAP0PTA5_9MAGN